MRHYAGSALMLIITMAAAIGSYTVNLRVSSERAAVDQLRKRLVADAREIRTLQVELRTRARLPEMQRWNDGVFQMSAPAAGQYLRSPVQLASYGAEPVLPMAKPDLQYAVTGPATVTVPTSGIVTASYAAPAAPATGSEAARLIRAGYTAAPKSNGLGDAPQPTLTMTAPRAPAVAAENSAVSPKRLAMLDAPVVKVKAAAPKPAMFKPVAPKTLATIPPDDSVGPVDLLPNGGQ